MCDVTRSTRNTIGPREVLILLSQEVFGELKIVQICQTTENKYYLKSWEKGAIS